MRMWTWLVSLLLFTLGVAQTQRSPQEAFMMQYFERRLAQLEVRKTEGEIERGRHKHIVNSFWSFPLGIQSIIIVLHLFGVEHCVPAISKMQHTSW